MKDKRTYEQRFYDNAASEAQQLIDITSDCRVDMHEPDEQDVDAKVHGRRFDNADLPGELTLEIHNGPQVFEINMATLVALARFGAKTILERSR